MPKRYTVFTGPRFYPLGGMQDFVGSADSIEKAKAVAAASDYPPEYLNWAHIFDSKTCKIILHYEGDEDSTWTGYTQ